MTKRRVWTVSWLVGLHPSWISTHRSRKLAVACADATARVCAETIEWTADPHVDGAVVGDCSIGRVFVQKGYAYERRS